MSDPGPREPDPAVADDHPAILLVNDDESCRWAMGRAFDRRGFAVATAEPVPAALELLNGYSPEYALLDLRMPGPSGMTLLKKLRESDPNTRIVMLTGFASIATAVEAIKLGTNDYLIKPVDADALVVALGAADAKALGVKRDPATGSEP
jgi:two-component system response regulator RegA